MKKLVLVAILAWAACAGGQDDGRENAAPDTAAAVDPAHLEAGARVVVVVTGDALAVSQDSVALPANGPVVFAVENRDTVRHTFKIEGNQRGEWSAPVYPGHTTQMSLILERGTYELMSPEDGSGRKASFKIY